MCVSLCAILGVCFCVWLGVLVCLSPDVRVFVWLYAHVRLCMSLCVRAFVSGCAIVCRVSECVLAFVRSCVCVCVCCAFRSCNVSGALHFVFPWVVCCVCCVLGLVRYVGDFAFVRLCSFLV